MFLRSPKIYKHHERSPLDNVYKALRNKDLSDCVVMAIKVLKETDNYMKFNRSEKSTSEARQLMVEGKNATAEGEYQAALRIHNKALMLAPFNSEAMRLCYYGRAELLLKTNQFWACVKDIETCLALNGSDSLARRLKEMRAIACRYELVELPIRKLLSTPFAEQFFTLKRDRNPDIPCATSDVEVIMDSGKPKVVAAKDIPVGTVLAVETSFIRKNNVLNNVISCHYCLKMNFNLIPCEGCCYVMFCDKQCKQKAMQEGHNVECKIVNILLDDVKLPVKAMLKIRQLCSSWDEFITASKDLGTDRMKNSTIAEIFGSDKFSLFNSHYDTHFIYGAMFNRCMYFANIIHYLDTHTSFFPNSPDDKNAAIHAVSRVMMHLSLYCTPVQQLSTTYMCTQGDMKQHAAVNSAYYPFIGNLPHSCLPNLWVVGLMNSAALITVEPIQKGAELTYSYTGHWLEVGENESPELRVQKLFNLYRTVCEDCRVCDGSFAKMFCKQPLNAAQMKAFKKFSRYHSPQNVKEDYKVACDILQALREVPCSKEYNEAFISFMNSILQCALLKWPNVTMAFEYIK